MTNFLNEREVFLMYCTRKITDDLIWIGSNDRQHPIFEAAHPVPRGMSYNSYLLLDEKTVLFDTVDRAVQTQFMENLEHALNGRALDYIFVHHMEPDHAATLGDLMLRHPEAKIVCNGKAINMIRQFHAADPKGAILVNEGDTLSTGKHNFTFVAAPMVHWPEVVVSYDSTDKILFSADGFGSFGALNGVLFADEVDWERDWLDEARRYYQTACQLDPGNVEYRQTLNFVENSAGGYRPEGYETWSTGCGGSLCGRMACAYLACNMCTCGSMRFFYC